MVALPELERIPVREAVTRYLAQVNRAVAGQSLSPITAANYTRDLTEFTQLAGPDTILDDLTAETLDTIFVTYAQQPDRRYTRTTKKPHTPGEPVRGRGPGAVARFRQSVNRLFTVAERKGWIALNPMSDTTVHPKTRGLAAAARLSPSEETARALIQQPAQHNHPPGTRAAWIAQRDTLILTLVFETGLRVSELCALNHTDITTKDGTPWLHVRHGKGGKPRHIPLTPRTHQLLHDWRDTTPPTHPKETPTQPDAAEAVFTSHTGKRLTPRSIQHLFTHYAAELPPHLRRHITPHAARHTAATLLLTSGAANVRTVQAILGHANLATTGIYLDVTDETLTQAITAHPLAN